MVSRIKLVIQVREATAGDLPRIGEIKVRSWADSYAQLVDADALRPFLDQAQQLEHLRDDMAKPDTLLLVASSPATLIGFALTFAAREPEPWLESLHVASEFRGQGVGTQLLAATAERLVALGYRSMRLGVVSGNAGAARLYERLGAEPAGVEPADWASGVTHEIYRWPDLALLQKSASAATR